MHSERGNWNSPNSEWEELIEKEYQAESFFRSFQRSLKLAGLGFNKEGKILDVGSGQGYLIEYLRKQGYDAIGVDRTPRNNFGNQVIAKGELLPFADAAFDYVVSNGAFDRDVYRQDQMKMFLEISRVLKTGGLYYNAYGETLFKAPDLQEISNARSDEMRMAGKLFMKQ